MRCDEAMTEIQRSLDGESSSAETRRLDRHLSACESCRRESTALTELKGLLTEVGVTDRPESRSLAPGDDRGRLAYRWPWWWMPVGAAALVLLAFAPWPQRSHDDSTGDLDPPHGVDSGVEVSATDGRRGPPAVRVDAPDGDLRDAGAGEREAGIELTSASENWLAVALPSESPTLHVFWVYETRER